MNYNTKIWALPVLLEPRTLLFWKHKLCLSIRSRYFASLLEHDLLDDQRQSFAALLEYDTLLVYQSQVLCFSA
jgi:hypothetical protein